MRIQKIEFLYKGNSLVIENHSGSKANIHFAIKKRREATHKALEQFVVYKNTLAMAVLKRAEELAIELCGKDEEAVVTDIYDVMCRMLICR